MANILTGSRVVCSIALLFFPAFSPWFYILYLICGFTDMIDGTVARKTGTASELGSKLDTVADFIFIAVCLIKLLPVIALPVWLLIWTALIAAMKMINVVSGFICCRSFVGVHTVMNKITGLLLFILPLTLPFIEIKYSGILACGAATFAAIQEGHIIRTGRLEINKGHFRGSTNEKKRSGSNRYQ